MGIWAMFARWELVTGGFRGAGSSKPETSDQSLQPEVTRQIALPRSSRELSAQNAKEKRFFRQSHNGGRLLGFAAVRGEVG